MWRRQLAFVEKPTEHTQQLNGLKAQQLDGEHRWCFSVRYDLKSSPQYLQIVSGLAAGEVDAEDGLELDSEPAGRSFVKRLHAIARSIASLPSRPCFFLQAVPVFHCMTTKL